MQLLVYGLALVALIYSAHGQSCQAPANVNLDDKYPFIEGGFQIFTWMTIPCSGQLTRWNFLAVNHLMLNLHLAVFRPVDSYTYQYIGDTYIQGPTPAPNAKGWISIAANPVINVQSGDVIGMYYDRTTMLAQLATIQSKRFTRAADPDTYSNYLTLVMIKDSSYVQDQGGVIDTTNATSEYRIPALYATIGKAATPASNRGKPVNAPVSRNQPVAAPAPAPATSSGSTAGCNMPPVWLPYCAQKTTRFYYDGAANACVAFIGCPASGFDVNNFDTSDDCNACKNRNNNNVYTNNAVNSLFFPNAPFIPNAPFFGF